MERHVVLGTGPVGTHLATVLAAQGKTVRCVNRSGNRGALPDSIELSQADLTDPAQAASAIAGASVTFQVSAPDYFSWDQFDALQSSIIDAAAAAGSDLVIADNLYAYGDQDGAVISEATPETPGTRKGRLRKSLADKALAAHRAGRLRVAISRPSDYFGPGYVTTQSMVVGNALAGKPMRWLGRTDVPHTFSYVPDVARAMAILGSSDDAWGRVWIPPVMEPVTLRDFSQMIWESAGQTGKAKVQALDGLGYATVSLFMRVLREAKEMQYGWRKPWLVDSSAFEKHWGMTATPLDAAVRESVEAARASAMAGSHRPLAGARGSSGLRPGGVAPCATHRGTCGSREAADGSSRW